MRLLNDFFFIEDSTYTEDSGVYYISLEASHIIFSAHFPGNPITPGVCMVQMATECLEKQLGRRLYLREVKNIKFLSVLSPEEKTKLKLILSNIKEETEGCKVQVTISSEETLYAKIALRYAYEAV